MRFKLYTALPALGYVRVVEASTVRADIDCSGAAAGNGPGIGKTVSGLQESDDLGQGAKDDKEDETSDQKGYTECQQGEPANGKARDDAQKDTDNAGNKAKAG